MKLVETHRIDERLRANAQHVAGLLLGVTHVLLAGVIFYRLYVLGQPDEEIRDFQAVLGISIFGYIALQLYLGGILPVLTLRGMLLGYLILAGAVTGGCLLIYGMPPISDWMDTWLPALGGPAILVGAYALLAHLGKRRLEKQIEE